MNHVFATIFLFATFCLIPAGSARAEEMTCPFDDGTILGLHHCVEHAIEMGFITNHGVGLSLLMTVDLAQFAFQKGRVRVAVALLKVFILEVNAQAGIHIAVDHAQHMVMHANHVIAALEGA